MQKPQLLDPVMRKKNISFMFLSVYRLILVCYEFVRRKTLGKRRGGPKRLGSLKGGLRARFIEGLVRSRFKETSEMRSCPLIFGRCRSSGGPRKIIFYEFVHVGRRSEPFTYYWSSSTRPWLQQRKKKHLMLFINSFIFQIFTYINDSHASLYLFQLVYTCNA